VNGNGNGNGVYLNGQQNGVAVNGSLLQNYCVVLQFSSIYQQFKKPI
jgi:hypothetical protein